MFGGKWNNGTYGVGFCGVWGGNSDYIWSLGGRHDQDVHQCLS